MFKKLKLTPAGWETDSRERKSYYIYFAGQNMIYTLVSQFLVTYLMFQGVNLAKAGTIMLAVKVWDAVNDAIFGVIFDSVKFKSGKKYLPWLKISTVLIPLSTLLLFFIPKSSGEVLKLAWFAVAYICWDTAYTLCDVPIYGVITSMTKNMDERNSMLSYKSIWGGVGTAVTTLIASVLVSEKVNSNYSVVAVITCVLAIATMTPVLFNIKERFNSQDEESFTIRKMFRYLFSNKYLLIYYIGFFFYSALNVSAAFNLFVSYYIFNNELFALVVGAIGVVPQLIFSLLIPKMLKKFDKTKLMILCNIANCVLSVIIWLVGRQNIYLYIVLSTLRAVPMGIYGVLMFMFTPDCAEYGKYKSGIEANGITFAIQTFMVKLTAAISGALGMFLLGLKYTGWISVEVENFQELSTSGVTQSVHALDVLWFVYVMVPAIGCALGLVVWKFYKLNDKDVQIMADCNAGKIERVEADEMLSRKY
ncbi:MAG: hypothetical protein E7536_02660 [Ruminococcaceae bacterium]|nr:hypothetical protein [Oscillospiraceae bacterium]